MRNLNCWTLVNVRDTVAMETQQISSHLMKVSSSLTLNLKPSDSAIVTNDEVNVQNLSP